MSRILVTGGCGFIGSNLARRLLADGRYEEIVVFDNESLGKRSDLPEGAIRFVHGDIRERAALQSAMEGCEAVVHLAAHTRVIESVESPELNFEINAQGTLNVLLAARELGVAHVVNASTGGAILGEVPPPVHEEMVPRPVSPYGASKLAAEGYCSAFAGAYGICTTSLRFSNVYGPLSYRKGSVVAHFLKQILEGQPLVVYGDGSQVRDFVFVEDLCRGIAQALATRSQGVYQLGSGQPTTVNELIEALRRVVGHNRAFEVLYEDFRAGEIYATYCDVTKARDTLGFDPATPLDEGLRRTWNWFVEVGKV